jgi:acyl-CoA dehydrogenase
VNVLTYQLAAPLARGPYTDLPKWLGQLGSCPFSGFVERAIWGGFHADRLGYAFGAGYSAALARLFDHAAQVQRISGKTFPNPPVKGIVCLAATESGGAHPRAITTRLDKQGGALVLRGEKTFVTLGTIADEMLVVATRGLGSDGRPRLRLARVKRGTRGVRMESRSATPFAPEIPHAIMKLDDVVIEDTHVLPGDGYEIYLKPFRTIEDTHVLAATVGYLAGAARAYEWDRSVLSELVALSLALVDVGARDPLHPLTHVVLDGILGAVRRLIGGLGSEWEKSDAGERDRWQRDIGLLTVADSARQKRSEVAFRALMTGSPPRSSRESM